MHALGWSCQKPERRALERDEEAIERWKREVWPEVKKGSSSVSVPEGLRRIQR
jgi:hypothetical protein